MIFMKQKSIFEIINQFFNSITFESHQKFDENYEKPLLFFVFNPFLGFLVNQIHHYPHHNM